MSFRCLFALWLALLACCMAGTSCGGNRSVIGPGSSGGGGTVTLTLSDAATCGPPSGPFTHIWISIADVEANPNAAAAAGGTGFVDLTPQLKAAPMQVDLLAIPSQCTLATLAMNASAPPGQYAQLRIVLAPDSSAGVISHNACGTAANCVQLGSNGSIQPIRLSAETSSGIVLAGAGLAAGSFTVASGQNQPVNIAFDACASIITAGGVITLNPVLSGGAITSGSETISGALIDGVSHGAISGRQIVALEQPSNGRDRILMETAAAASGAFSFCPVPPGTYDLAASASTAMGGQFAPTFLTGVPNGTAIGKVALFAGAGLNANPGTVQLGVTSVGAAGAAPVAVRIAARERILLGTQTFDVTIPILQEPAATIATLTTTAPSCAPGQACSSTLLSLPALSASFARFQTSGSFQVIANITTPAIYQLAAQAFIPSSGGVATCSPAEQTTGNVAISPNGAATASVPLTGCP